MVDDCDVVINGLRCILKPHQEFEIVGEASDGCEAVVKAEGLRPDIVLMDAQMPIMDGIESTRRIKESVPGVKILVLAVHATHLDAAIYAGADGFIMKDSSRSELVEEIRRLTGTSAPVVVD